MMKLETKTYESRAEFDLILITEDAKEFVKKCGVKDGLFVMITQHTTTSIMVQESLPCLEGDIEEKLEALVPKNVQYAHNHFLPTYGATGGNSPGHIESMRAVNHGVLPIQDGKVVLGHAQEVYFAEFDGIKTRKYFIQVMGERKKEGCCRWR